MFKQTVRLALFLLVLQLNIMAQLFGGGTENNPYLIYSAADFNLIENNDGQGVWFRQMAIITITNYGLDDFRGVYDGNGYMLYNGNLSPIVTNLRGTLKNMRVTLNTFQNFVNTIQQGAYVQNCEVTIPAGNVVYGGGVAVSSNGLIEDSKVIMGSGSYIYAESPYSAGGIVGAQTGYSSTVRRCSVSGGSINGGSARGGIAGEAVTIDDCTANTTIGTGDYAGGIAGKLISSSGNFTYGLINNSYFRGNLSGTGQYRGGIAGYAMDLTTIQKSYAAASLGATSNSAPAIGAHGSGVTIEKVFWDAEVQGYFNQSKALQFDGTDDHVTIPADIVNFPGNFTFEAWVYWEGGGNWQRVFDFGTGTGIYMFFTPSNGSFARFAITRGGGSSEQVINASARLTTGIWNHIAITINTSTTTGKLYINGVEAGSNSAMTLFPGFLGSTTLNYLGRSQYASDAYFKGKIDEVRIWSEALPLSTINDWKYRYLTSDHPNTANLVAYYKIDETSGTTIANDKNTSYNGTLQNGGTFVKDASAAPTDKGIGKLTQDMKNEATFLAVGYDPAIWFRDDGYNDGYPYLAWENPGGSPLPVELTSFTARATAPGVTLNWETKTEVMNAGFEVERKTGATEWHKIGFVEGHYTTNSPKYYSFTDKPATTGKVFYRLKQIDTDGAFEYSPEVSVDLGLPTAFALDQNYPNPFNPETVIRYMLPTGGDVSIVVYNSLGEKITTLVDGVKEAGNHQVSFKADNLPSGVYFYRMTAGKFTSTRKMMLLR